VLDTSITNDLTESLSGNHELKLRGWVWSFPFEDILTVSGGHIIWDTTVTIARFWQASTHSLTIHYDEYGQGALTYSDTIKFTAGDGLKSRTIRIGGFAMSALVGRTFVSLR